MLFHRLNETLGAYQARDPAAYEELRELLGQDCVVLK